MLTYGFCGHDPGNFCLTKRRRGAILAAPEYRRKLAIPSMHKQQTKRPSRVPWRAAAIIAPVLLLAACTPPGPSLVGRELGTTPAYIIGPGDVVNVFVYRAPELSVEAPVRPDGKISTPLVPDVPALGKTPTQLASEIEERLQKFVKEPNVTVMVTSFSGPAEREIKVIGEVGQPLEVPYRAGLSVLDLMIAAKGLTKFAAGNRAMIVRQEPGGLRTYNVRLDDLMTDGDIAQNVQMQPGDTLVVPQAWF